MYRIAHISDLHIQHPDSEPGAPGMLQKLVATLGSQFATEVVADAHNPSKLAQLKNVMRLFSPNLILVTGDLTNFGDEASYQLAVKELLDLKNEAGAEKILCVPGNHDALRDRAQALSKGSWGDRLVLRLGSAFSPIVRNARELSRKKPSVELEACGSLPYLDTYLATVPREFGVLDSSNPMWIPMPWGELAIFLFNSTNDGLVLCNEGAIGNQQYERFNQQLQHPHKLNRIRNALRIAMIHHHPISAPISEGMATRGFDTMRDGTQFLEFLNRHKFHFVLHGHQHVPYHASICYDEEAILHLVAAGSALAGDDSHPSSFNILDLTGPYRAHLRRIPYHPTGFLAGKPEAEADLQLQPYTEVRISPADSLETAEDVTLRNFVRGDPRLSDFDHQYDLLRYEIEVTRGPDLYKAWYYRKGTVRRPIGGTDRGLVFFLSGSPAMAWADMKVKALTNENAGTLKVELQQNLATQKKFIVLHKTPLSDGEAFDVSLYFEWRLSQSEPATYDGVNLMYFRHPVGRLEYEATLPWDPIHHEVVTYGIRIVAPDQENFHAEVAPAGEGKWKYSMSIDQPKHLAYRISYPDA